MNAVTWWKTRPAGAQPLPERPNLDEAWVWYMSSCAEVPASFESMCHYTEDVRQGRWPDQVAPEVALQSVYLAMVHQFLGTSDRQQFERDIRVLFDAVAACLAQGRAVEGTSVAADVPALRGYLSTLANDKKLFAEDVGRAERLEVTLPRAASPTGSSRAVRMLVFDRPSSAQFKLWARLERRAAMLLVRAADGSLVLSVDPSEKLTLGWAAELLSQREGKPWYAGERHHATLVASPRDGTRLGLADVLDVLSLEARVMRRRPLAGLAVVGGVGALLLTLLFAGEQEEAAPSFGAKGTALSNEAVMKLLATDDGPRGWGQYALVAGACAYAGERSLRAPCDDARAVKARLEKLGYPPANILLFVDDPRPGEVVEGAPTAQALKLAVERFGQRFPQADETSRFLFYYSGHGGYEKGARKDFGVLQPTGYFDDETRPMSARGWDMQELIDDVRKGVPARHVFLLLDACYSGWAVGAKGDDALSVGLLSLWQERAEVVLTAGTQGQRAWEAPEWGGHSALTAFVLEGLGASGSLQADLNADSVVTDEELAAFVRQRVPPAVASLKGAVQTPQFVRFDELLPRSGQFLFTVPK
jgi:hypothetical protein